MKNYKWTTTDSDYDYAKGLRVIPNFKMNKANYKRIDRYCRKKHIAIIVDANTIAVGIYHLCTLILNTAKPTNQLLFFKPYITTTNQ
jgi:hypothetical protein